MPKSGLPNKGKGTTRKVLKHQRIIGQSQYLDKETGELIPCLETEQLLEEKDFNFSKMWIGQYFDSVEEITNKKRRMADWLIENRDKENKITYTYRQMADATGFSLETVTRTMKALIKAGLIIRINMGCYMINPDIVWKGGTSDRMAVVQVFRTRKAPRAEIEGQITLGGEDDGAKSAEGGDGESGQSA